MAKHKMKTKKAAAKRFKVTGSGRVMRRQTGQRHLLSKRSRRRKRRLSVPRAVEGKDARNIKKILNSK